MIRLSIIVPTSGRSTLTNTLASIAPQLRDGDEVLCAMHLDAPWGHKTRRRLLNVAAGTHLAFIDDDDVYAPDALDTIRRAVAAQPDRVHMFHLLFEPGSLFGDAHRVEEGLLGTANFIVPNVPELLGEWTDRYAGDFDFIESTMRLRGDEPVWHDEITVIRRPHEHA